MISGDKIRHVQTHEDEKWTYGETYDGDFLFGTWCRLKNKESDKKPEPNRPLNSLVENMNCPHDKKVSGETDTLVCCICEESYLVPAWRSKPHTHSSQK